MGRGCASEQDVLKGRLEESFREIRTRQETAEASEKVVLELQAWRERVARGKIVEMSPVEAKRLRWSVEHAETLEEANSSLR